MSQQSATTGTTTPGSFRWLLVAGGLLLQFSIGAVYAWSVFSGALEKAESWQLSKVKASMPFTVTIGMIFIGSYVGGRLRSVPRVRSVTSRSSRHGPGELTTVST